MTRRSRCSGCEDLHDPQELTLVKGARGKRDRRLCPTCLADVVGVVEPAPPVRAEGDDAADALMEALEDAPATEPEAVDGSGGPSAASQDVPLDHALYIAVDLDHEASSATLEHPGCSTWEERVGTKDNPTELRRAAYIGTMRCPSCRVSLPMRFRSERYTTATPVELDLPIVGDTTVADSIVASDNLPPGERPSEAAMREAFAGEGFALPVGESSEAALDEAERQVEQHASDQLERGPLASESPEGTERGVDPFAHLDDEELERDEQERDEQERDGEVEVVTPQPSVWCSEPPPLPLLEQIVHRYLVAVGDAGIVESQTSESIGDVVARRIGFERAEMARAPEPDSDDIPWA